MSTVGLTKAMREALENTRDHGDSTYGLRGRSAYGGHTRVLLALNIRGLLRSDGYPSIRGHAALAAPRMTQAEYDWLCYIDGGAEGTPSPMYMRLFNRGWIEPATAGLTRLTPAGRTALNNVRAAMGSPDWKEGL